MDDGISDVKIGQSLPREEWLRARDDLAAIFEGVARSMLERDPSENGKHSAQKFVEDARLALIALDFVGNTAADKCRLVLLPTKNL